SPTLQRQEGLREATWYDRWSDRLIFFPSLSLSVMQEWEHPLSSSSTGEVSRLWGAEASVNLFSFGRDYGLFRSALRETQIQEQIYSRVLLEEEGRIARVLLQDFQQSSILKIQEKRLD